jgi:hypothetical protein
MDIKPPSYLLRTAILSPSFTLLLDNKVESPYPEPVPKAILLSFISETPKSLLSPGTSASTRPNPLYQCPVAEPYETIGPSVKAIVKSFSETRFILSLVRPL